MISTAGMNTMLAYTLVTREKALFQKGIQEDPTSKREIAAFKENIGKIKSVDDLMKKENFETYSFVMKAFGMEREIPSKAMVKKILTSDPADKKSLVNRLTSNSYRELNAIMGFKTDGTAGDYFEKDKWVTEMVDKYLDQRLLDSQKEQSPAVASALEFKDKAAGMTNWYKVLGDKNASKILRTVLGLPASISNADVDAQKRLFEKKMNIEDLKDPAKVDKLISKYTAIASATESYSSAPSVLSLFSYSTNSGSYASPGIDVSLISSLRGRG